MIKVMAKTANVISDNFDGQPGTYEPAREIDGRVLRDGLAHIRGKVANYPNIVIGLGNPPLAVMKSRK